MYILILKSQQQHNLNKYKIETNIYISSGILMGNLKKVKILTIYWK